MKWISDVIVNFFVRMVIGIVLIFFINQFLVSNEIDVNVGINPVTVVTAGTLGFQECVYSMEWCFSRDFEICDFLQKIIFKFRRTFTKIKSFEKKDRQMK